MAELRPTLTITGIALGCALILAITNRLTEAPIERNETAAERAILMKALGRHLDDGVPVPDLSAQPAVWDDCGQKQLARLDVAGYAGPIRLLFTTDTGRRSGAGLLHVLLLGHQETPGITDFLREGTWLDGLAGRSADELRAADAVTGATITSRAITGGLADVLRAPEALGLPQPLGPCP